uniref:Galectin domain-containing protein n=1 Tax=Globodera rostochiensis TaxID=31243 RepID=A0A914HFC3_GLORO
MIIFCFWMLVHAAQAQEETTPTRLTGLGKNISTIPVALLDQCFPYEESKTFGIEFRLPRTGGKCDDGLIICYPGSLATRTLDNAHSLNGMSVNSELFNVDNAVNNSLGKYCAGLNVSWHGIKVNTEKSNGKNIIKLSTSLLEEEEQSFEIPDAHRQFIIHFGNENEFSAYVTVEGQRIDLDVVKAEQYMQLAPNGAHLKDFVGFWTLGLDMLPWMDHEVKLFINRSCSCSMEAWFIRPTDGEPNDPEEPSTGIGGPKAKCIVNTTKEVPLNNRLKANHLIRIQMLIDGNALDNSITFAILNEYRNVLMKFKMSTGQNATIQMKWPFKPVSIENANLPEGNGTRHADFIIALTEYSYGIVMNKKLLGGKEFFPAKWTNGLPFNDMKSLWLSGQFLLLTDPLVMPFHMLGQQNYKPQEQKLPYWERISIVQPDTNVIFRVKLGQNDNDFNISLLHNRIDLHKSEDSIGAEVLTLRVQPEKDQIWRPSRVEGNITLLGRPEVEPPPEQQRTYNFSIQLKRPLDYNDTIQLKLNTQDKTKNLSILLMHDALRGNNEIGGVVLGMFFHFDGYKCTLYCSSVLSADPVKEDTGIAEVKNLTGIVDGRLNKYGQKFDMDITALNDNFKIHIKEVKLTHLCPYPESNGTFYPPWAVDYIRFENDVQVHAMNIMHPPTSEQRNFMQINDTNDLVQAGDLITVKLAITGDLNDNSSVAINLFHQALEFNEKVGKTVMKVMLNSASLYFNSSKPLINNSTNERNCTNGKLDKELKELKIGVMDKGFFNVTLTWNNDSSTTCTYTNGLPEWAVQYITVEHNDVTLSNPPNIICVPEKRYDEEPENHSTGIFGKVGRIVTVALAMSSRLGGADATRRGGAVYGRNLKSNQLPNNNWMAPPPPMAMRSAKVYDSKHSPAEYLKKFAQDFRRKTGMHSQRHHEETTLEQEKRVAGAGPDPIHHQDTTLEQEKRVAGAGPDPIHHQDTTLEQEKRVAGAGPDPIHH